jgi:hypothetical protein
VIPKVTAPMVDDGVHPLWDMVDGRAHRRIRGSLDYG